MKKLLAKAAAKRKLGDDTNAYRIVNGAGDGLPGVEVDRYADYAVVSLRAESAAAAEQSRVLDDVLALGFRGVYLKVRPKKASTLVSTRRDDVAPSEAVRGESAPPMFTIRELGLDYQVRLGDGLSTGIFLDQRENRRMIRELSQGKRVLNLFCYHAAFSIAAIAGGASDTVSVDASGRAVERARENMAAYRADRVYKADVMKFLRGGGERFDVAILDPPSFSQTKKTTFRASRDYHALAAAAFRRMSPGATLLACTNHRSIAYPKLRGQLRQGADEAGVEIARLDNLPDPTDFPPPPTETCHLKSVLVQLSR